jgi:small conductance mechanosensitive channel
MEQELSSIGRMTQNLMDSGIDLGIRILVAIVIYIIGRILISWILKALSKIKSVLRMDETARIYVRNITKAVLYTALFVTIVAELGVPISSMVAILVAAGAAIGLALQGALSNFAGGLMLLIFRPFSVGDYIESGGSKGYVKSISLVYTVIRTFDNRIIMIPNGTLMNSVVTNDTATDLRRVDLSFDISASEPGARVREVILAAVNENEKVLIEPEPVVAATGSVTDGISYAVRVWTATDDYWSVYEPLMESIPEALNRAGIKRPATPVRVDQQ